MKRIVKVNRHTADCICTLSQEEFQREREIRTMTWVDLRQREQFGYNKKTELIETESYIYLYVEKRENELPF